MEGRGRSFKRGRFVKPKAGDRVKTAAGLEGEVLFVSPDRTTACVELDGSDGKTAVYRLDKLTRIDEGDKKRKR
jgi:preprotein translocase subunit YajC